jgi:nitrogen regulatory protein P-II 1
MKKIEAFIKPFKFEEVKKALVEIGIPGLTVSNVLGLCFGKGRIERFRGAEYTVDLIPKVKLEIFLSDEDEEKIVATIMAAAKTGEAGDGKIFVLPLSDAVGIRTGELGEAAIY